MARGVCLSALGVKTIQRSAETPVSRFPFDEARSHVGRRPLKSSNMPASLTGNRKLIWGTLNSLTRFQGDQGLRP